MSMIFRQCEKCGATLDPGEKCDCDNENDTDMSAEKNTNSIGN